MSTGLEITDFSTEPEHIFTPEPDLEPAPVFPLDGLPEPLRLCVEDTMRVYGVREDLPTICGLGAASVAIGKGLHILEGSRPTRGNLYCLASAPSGTGKSSTIKPFVAPLWEIQAEMNEEFERDYPAIEAERDLLEAEANQITKKPANDPEGSKARLTKIKARLKELERESQPRRLMAENITSEKLGILMVNNNETLGVISADGGEIVSNWMGEHRKSGRTDEAPYLKGWSGDSCQVDRVSREPVSLKAPCLSVLLGCTPDEVGNLFANGRFVIGGLMPRFLVCESWSRPKPRHEGDSVPALTPAVWGQWSAVIKKVYQLSNTGRWEPAVKLSPEARQQFNKAHNAYCASFDIQPQGDAFAARQVEQAMRIALVLHAIEHPNDPARHPLSEQTARTALALGDCYGQAARRHQEGARQRQDGDTLERIRATAVSHGRETPEGWTVSTYDLKNRNGLTPEQLKAFALRHPKFVEIVTREPGPKGGRPSQIFLIKNG